MTDQWPANRYWGENPRPTSKAEFFNAVTTPVTGDGGGKVATIRMYGPIDSWGGFWGINTKDVGQVLDALGDDVEQIILRINSPGGEVWEAMSILNMLRAHKAKVLAVVDGLAASAASFIAAGADETVMSPGTTMMIHSPSGFTWGNAADHRKTAEILDSLQASMTEIYTGKAGAKDWPALLAEETWLTATEAVDLGLADRVAVVPDAGETATVSDEELVVLIDDFDDSARITHLAAGIRPAAVVPAVGLRPVALKPPSSPEPVDTNQKKEKIGMSDTLKAGLLERLGITDAAATDDAILASVDAVLETATAPTPPAAALPEGTTLIDSTVLEELRANAAAGVQALAAQTQSRHEEIIATALREGRIAAASKDVWVAQLQRDEASATTLLASLPAGVVPVAETGYDDSTESTTGDRLYDAAFGTSKKES